jgi:hypothetical protein
MKRRYLTVALFAGLSLGSVANAAMVWNFTSGVAANTDLTTSPISFTSTGGSPDKTILAYGAHADGSLTDLYAKVTGGNPVETGLGTFRGSEFEIDNNHFIELDVSSLTNLTTLSFLITSVQSGETFNWGKVDGAGSPGGGNAPFALSSFTPLGSITGSGSGGTNTFSFTRDSAAREFIAISITTSDWSSDVLLSTATVTSTGGQGTPEPRFYGLLLVGMLAIPAIRRRFVPQQ